MSRIRTIKPEMLVDKIIANLSDGAYRLFVSAILLADDYGNLPAEIGQLQGNVFWGPDSPSRDTREGISVFLEELARKKLLTRYSVRDQEYAFLNGWFKHQKIDKPSKPKYPSIREAERIIDEPPRWLREELARVSRDSIETLAPEEKGREGKGGGGERSEREPAPPKDVVDKTTSDPEPKPPPEGFEPVPGMTHAVRPKGIEIDVALRALADGSRGKFTLGGSSQSLASLKEIADGFHPEPLTVEDFRLFGEAWAAGKALSWMNRDRPPSLNQLVDKGGKTFVDGINDARTWAKDHGRSASASTAKPAALSPEELAARAAEEPILRRRREREEFERNRPAELAKIKAAMSQPRPPSQPPGSAPHG